MSVRSQVEGFVSKQANVFTDLPVRDVLCGRTLPCIITQGFDIATYFWLHIYCLYLLLTDVNYTSMQMMPLFSFLLFSFNHKTNATCGRTRRWTVCLCVCSKAVEKRYGKQTLPCITLARQRVNYCWFFVYQPVVFWLVGDPVIREFRPYIYCCCHVNKHTPLGTFFLALSMFYWNCFLVKICCQTSDISLALLK